MTNDVSPLLVLQARAEVRAILYAAGELTLQDAVDGCQQAAEAYGLVAEIGQDAVQAIIASAFMPYRDDLDMVPNPIEEATHGGVAESTLQAADYLLRQNDERRFESWLAKHSKEERKAIINRIKKRRRA
jgi:hypothetical protein